LHNLELVGMLRKAKVLKKFTMNDIADKSGVGIRTVNRIFAGQDVRFSSMIAVLDALHINLDAQFKQAA